MTPRRAGQADRHHPRPDQRRAGQPGRGDRQDRPGGRGAFPAGRLPIDRPDAGGRREVSAATCSRRPGANSCAVRGGSGFLYARRDRIDQLEPPFLDLHAATWMPATGMRCARMPAGSRTGRRISPRKIGLGAALDYALEWGIDLPGSESRCWRGGCAAGWNDCPGVTIRDLGEVRCGIVTFTVARPGSRGIQRRLRALGINVTVSDRGFDPAGHGEARPTTPGARVRALLQQRGGCGAVLQSPWKALKK